MKLYRCTLCKVRMFECDRRGHIDRHGIDVADGELGRYFKAGPKDTPALVGGSWVPMKKRKKPKPKP